MMKLTEVNAMNEAEFVAAFSDVAEHSPWVAEGAFEFLADETLIAAFTYTVRSAPRDKQLSLLRAHPDLATRAKLTADSTAEQRGAGLDTLSAKEFAKFSRLNDQYKEQNGFPFIFAVKGATKHQILDSFETRIHHTKEEEFEVALQQVCKIIGFRLEAKLTL
jgi:2-oxo-4-hydroxy-4-carboxy-5-ureidoimidazoline decarboxylase